MPDENIQENGLTNSANEGVGEKQSAAQEAVTEDVDNRLSAAPEGNSMDSQDHQDKLQSVDNTLSNLEQELNSLLGDTEGMEIPDEPAPQGSSAQRCTSRTGVSSTPPSALASAMAS